jgi:hypothetical protein
VRLVNCAVLGLWLQHVRQGKLPVKDGWVFEGWIYQHGKAPLGGPVSTQQLRELIASRRLRANDLTWKKFTKNGESCFSSPVTVAVAIATADRD